MWPETVTILKYWPHTMHGVFPTVPTESISGGFMQLARILNISLLAASALSLGVASESGVAADITGAGATFPYPIYAKWAEAYKQKTGVGLNYQSIGSGGGIKQIRAKTVDFGASDAPLKADELAKDGQIGRASCREREE